MVSEPQGPGPFGLYGLTAIPLGETPDTLEELVSGYTSYDTRMRITQLLVDELGVPPQRAVAAAVVILYVTYSGEDGHRIEHEEAAVQRVLPGFEVPATNNVGLWPLRGVGGWVALDFVSGALHVRMSIPMSDTYGTGFGPQLRGCVHPVSGTSLQWAGMVANWPPTPPEIETNYTLPLEVQSGEDSTG
jgi:hypothetical protein